MEKGTITSVKIGNQVYPSKVCWVSNPRPRESLDGFGWKDEPFTFSSSFTLSPDNAKKLKRIVSGRTLPLKQRKRRQRQNWLIVTMKGRQVGRIAGQKLFGLMRNSHRNWMILGRAACERDYREVSRG